MALELPSTLHWNVRQWSDPALQFQVGHFLTPGTWDWIRWEVLDKGEPGILNQICSFVSLKSFAIPFPSQLPLYYSSLTPFHAYLVLLPFSCLFLPFVPAMPPPQKTSFFQGYRFACYDIKPDHRYEDSLVFKLNRLIHLSLLRLTEDFKWPEVEPSHLSLHVCVSCWNLVSFSYYHWCFLPLVACLCWLGVFFL